MSVFTLNLGENHATSLLNLVNHDNSATIGTELTISNTGLSAATANEDGSFAVVLTNKAHEADQVTVNYQKLSMGDFIDMTYVDDTDLGDFDGWYDPDNWSDETSPAAAVTAFKAAAVRGGVDPEALFKSVVATRAFDDVQNHYYLTITVESYVFKDTVSYKMPRFFSEEITEYDLQGFSFEPIAVSAVVDPLGDSE